MRKIIHGTSKYYWHLNTCVNLSKWNNRFSSNIERENSKYSLNNILFQKWMRTELEVEQVFWNFNFHRIFESFDPIKFPTIKYLTCHCLITDTLKH